MSKVMSLVVFLGIVFSAAVSGSQFTPGEMCLTLTKPSWVPPNWVFPVVWTTLYIMIAIAGWLVWRRAGWCTALTVWGIGLVINALWSYFMFGRQEIGLALADVTALWVAVALFINLAWNLDRMAAYLFLPYLAWVTIAAALNFEVWRLN